MRKQMQHVSEVTMKIKQMDKPTYKNIKINDTFDIQRDSCGWTLRTISKSVDGKGKLTESSKSTYYGQLSHVCAAIIDRQAGMEESIGDIKEMLTKASTSLTKEIGVFFK